MISVNEAKKIIQEQLSPLDPVQLPLLQAAGLTLAADVFSMIDSPPFDQSSMDGYAFCFDGWKNNAALEIEGEIAAGSNTTKTYSSEKAVRIFTGAPVPQGTDTVVMQEKVTVTKGVLTIEDQNIHLGVNVRRKGTDSKVGELALKAGNKLTPGAIGFLTGIGITSVSVFPKPAVSIIVTGNELQAAGKPLQHGQVYESNSATIRAALQQLNINEVKVFWAEDNLNVLQKILEEAISVSDVIVLMGGISVGDYDYVLQAAENCGVTKLFHRIKQKPGKPLYFGKKENKLIFGLPGNPSSVLTCYYEYLFPALQQLSNQLVGLKELEVPLLKSIDKVAGLTQFLKGYFDGEKVMPLGAQESYRLSTFANANCLIVLDENTNHCEVGENVNIHLLPL
ncbi:MAG: molybdopterin molybdenumtransferase MoeA [Chitinophagia bacterium]|nr:molybdopterin molybdenumtransferase MoeA [Chitinophagia bacterium]